MSDDTLRSIGTRATPQRERVPNRPEQVENNAGGFVFEVSPVTRIRRFLILGTDGSTYYQGEKEYTKQNADVVLDWAQNRTQQLVDILTEISVQGRAPKQNPTIFALAAAAAIGSDDASRSYALSKLPEVCRTGTQLFMFNQYYSQFRGWGRKLRRAVGRWYNDKPVDNLAYQMVKYRQRGGWSQRDLLRLAHPVTDEAARKGLYDWVTKGDKEDFVLDDAVPGLVRAFLAAQKATTAQQWVELIGNSSLSWEMLPDAALSEPKVWAALINKSESGSGGMPQGALIRQLPRLSRLGLFNPGSSLIYTVAAQLTDQRRITKARIHPVNLFIAQRTYASGRSVKGDSVWSPNSKIVDALDEAFYLSFGNVEPANKRTLNALDISGSMGMDTISNLPVTPREASAAMSLVTVKTEPDVTTVGFSSEGSATYRGGYRYGGNWREDTKLIPLAITARQRLDDAIKSVSDLPFGGTDCALPMIWAQENNLEIDTFIIWTDNETWAGKIQPFQALREYRRASGIPARLVVCGMTSTNFSIADPNDAGMLDVTGFDSAVPNLISDFSAGRI